MTYLELQKEVEQLQYGLPESMDSLEITVVSDMPLQPWFDLYLKKFWAEKGRMVVVKRVLWEQRKEQNLPIDDATIFWPSSEVEAEMETSQEKAGIWIRPEKASDPMMLFYGSTRRMQQEVQYPAGSCVIDLENIMLQLGLENCLAGKEKRWGDRYSRQLQKKVAEQVVRAYETRHGRRKKCIILDCDGVLWGGIISEDGLTGIVLSETGRGKRYQQFQELLIRLRQHGIVLAVCSKNDEEDVKQVFCSHTAMKLQESDIAAWSVSWKPKSQQVAELAEKLQIDPQDMVLVDDNLWEIAEVQSQYPQVGGVHFDTSAEERAVYEKLAKLIWLQPEDENLQNQLRVQTYADNVKREVLRKSASTFEEFLEKLQTKAEVRPVVPADLPRISDLSRRANQCTNGTRYTLEELQKRLSNGYQLQSVFVSDIYRDLGLVGCIGIDLKDNSLDLFCLSCRALGRRLEQQLLAALPPEISKLRWQDTGKNAGLLEIIRREGRWQV